MNTCDTCKWWQYPFAGTRYGVCIAIDPLSEHDDDQIIAVAMQADPSGAEYLPIVYTGPKFGCVQHEHK